MNQNHSSIEKWTIGKSATITDLGMCINKYRLMTPGLYACINVGVKLGEQIIYPDMMVMIGSGAHQQCKPDYESNYFVGPPNFIIEIRDSRSPAAKERKQLFSSFGVQEYVIVNELSTKVEWNRLTGGKFKVIKPDREGLIKSTSLPGMWIPIEAVKQKDYWAIMAAIEHGVSRRAHHELMSTIWKKD